MPWDALPEHLNSPEKWKGTDWDNGFQRWLLPFKGWFFYGPRSKKSWAAWKSPPRLLIGYGVKRWESLRFDDLYLQNRKYETKSDSDVLLEDGYFPSVVQYWSRWHILLQWPLHFSFHLFWKKGGNASYPERKDFTIKEMFSIRFGARYDKDDIYNFPSAGVGGDFV